MTHGNKAAVLILVAVGTLLAHPSADAAERKTKSSETTRATAKLPRGFVYLDTLAPDIINDMRYATPDNFTGRRVPGYHANRCILARPVARAVARVQKAVKKTGYTLKVYDCYRPTRGVHAFFQWAQARFGRPNKAYYPRISRSRIIPLGYIAKRSSHSRGTAIDLTLVKLAETATITATAQTTAKSRRRATGIPCIKPEPERAPASIDMGTSWDCFDELSHTHHGATSGAVQANRRRLLRAMQAEGFRNYRREWWHYSMSLRQFQRLHNFPVE
jgi:D-alanyl-D-alanine dipeptidase